MQLKDGSKGSNGYSALVTLASKSVAIVLQALDRSKLCPLTVDDRLIRELDLLVVATHPKHVCHYLNITLTFLCKIATHQEVASGSSILVCLAQRVSLGSLECQTLTS